ncbi:Protein Ycf2 [Bienertia sinuspersici]
MEQEFPGTLEHFVSEQKTVSSMFDRLRINQYSIDWSEVIDKKDLSKSLRFILSKLLRFFLSKSEIRIYELKGRMINSTIRFRTIGLQIVHLKKWKAFLLDDHDTFQKSKFLINGGTYHILFNKIPKIIAGNPLITRILFLNDIPRSKHWLNPEEARINNYDFTYRQFLNILFITTKYFLFVSVKKTCFFERDTISPIESQVSNIFIPNDFPIRSNLFVRRTIYSIADISGTPLTEGQIVHFEELIKGRTCISIQFQFKHEFYYTPCSEKYLLSEKRKKQSLCLRNALRKGRCMNLSTR